MGDWIMSEKLRKISLKLHKLDSNSDDFKNELKKLWRNKSFHGSYSGTLNFRRFLKYELNIELSERKIREILQQIPSFNIYIRHVKNYKTRHYNVHGSFQVWEADLGKG